MNLVGGLNYQENIWNILYIPNIQFNVIFVMNAS
jgi:hypothetical protein